jgi:membrane fusion protein (multidrug efflux system)
MGRKEGGAVFGYVLTAAVIWCAVWVSLWGCQKKVGGTEPPVTVQVAEVLRRDVPVYSEWVGTTDGAVNAVIRAQVQGYLIVQNYHEGDVVRKGQVLFEIDARPFRAALDQANGNLAEQQARWTTARANLARVVPLAEQNAVSKKDLDDAVGQEQGAHAAVLSARALVEKAALDVGFTRIISPVDGIAGIAKAQIGNLVGPGVTEELTTVSTVDPIRVYICVGEQDYLGLMEPGRSVFREIPLEMVLADGRIYPYKGRFSLADRQVDVKTGTIKLAAFFRNPGNYLRPGQFGKIRAQDKVKRGALLVPQRAVTELQGSYQVAVVGADNKVDVRMVKVGERVGSLWVIDEGLKPGEKVVAEGVQKVRQAMVVRPEPYVGSRAGAGKS